jgi:hypothetical protein
MTEQRRAGWTVDRGAPLLETCARKQPDARSPSKPLSAASGPQSIGPPRICLNEIECCTSSSLSLFESVTLESLLVASQRHEQAIEMHMCFQDRDISGMR